MASDALLAALQGATYNVAEDPYYMGAQIIGRTNLYNPYESTGTNVGYSLGSALLAGLLGGYAQNRVEDKNASLLTDANKLMEVGAEERQALAEVNPRLSPLVLALSQQDRENELIRAAETRKLENAVEQAKRIEEATNPAKIELEKAKALARRGEIDYKHSLRMKEKTAGGGSKKEESIIADATDPYAIIEKAPDAATRKVLREKYESYLMRPELEKQIEKLYSQFDEDSPLKMAFPGTEANAKSDAANASIVSIYDKLTTGVTTDPDALRTIKAYAPTPLDLAMPGRKEIKKQAFKEFVAPKIDDSMLESYGLIPKKAQGMTPQQKALEILAKRGKK